MGFLWLNLRKAYLLADLVAIAVETPCWSRFSFKDCTDSISALLMPLSPKNRHGEDNAGFLILLLIREPYEVRSRQLNLKSISAPYELC